MSKQLSETAQQTLKDCTVTGNTIKLPLVTLERSVYVEVKNKLELIGGKWKGGKTQGFEFSSDPSELLIEISGGASINLKKDFQFFATPEPLADRLVALAEINDIHDVLEPSAGQGAIIKAIHKKHQNIVSCFELMPTNQIILKRLNNIEFLGQDFLKESTYMFDRIVANPPFSKNQDIDHIKKMYNSLRIRGKLVSVASKHWQLSSNKKESEFREWLMTNSAKVLPVEKGEFKESGTMIETCIIVIDKL